MKLLVESMIAITPKSLISEVSLKDYIGAVLPSGDRVVLCQRADSNSAIADTFFCTQSGLVKSGDADNIEIRNTAYLRDFLRKNEAYLFDNVSEMFHWLGEID